MVDKSRGNVKPEWRKSSAVLIMGREDKVEKAIFLNLIFKAMKKRHGFFNHF